MTMLGKHHSEETKRRISEAQRGQKRGEEFRAKMRVASRGNVSHKGFKLTIEQRIRVSKGTRLAMQNPLVKEKLRIAKTGQRQSLETIAKRVDKVRGRKNSDAVKAKMSEGKRRNWQDPEFRQKTVTAWAKANIISPSKPELQLGELLSKLFPHEYEYTGDNYEKVIDGLCPDFTHSNGQKKVIELFGDWWHGETVTGHSNEDEEREKGLRYKMAGYKCLIIWEHELKDEKDVIQKIIKFTRT